MSEKGSGTGVSIYGAQAVSVKPVKKYLLVRKIHPNSVQRRDTFSTPRKYASVLCQEVSR